MALSWIYRTLMEAHLYKPPFSAEKDKNTGSNCYSKFDEFKNWKQTKDLTDNLKQSDDNNKNLDQTRDFYINLEQSSDHTNNLKQSRDFTNPRVGGQSKDSASKFEQSNGKTNQMKEAPTFLKKKVYYFSPSYFADNGSCVNDSIYKFYLKSLQENYPKNNIHTTYYNVSKTDNGEISVFNFEGDKHINQEKLHPEKFIESSTVSENQIMNDVSNQHCDKPLVSEVLGILHNLLAFPFCVARIIMDSNNTEYYSTKYQDQSALNTNFPDPDIYAMDDQTFETFCLLEREDITEESPASKMLKKTESKTETKNMKNDGDWGTKHSFLTSDVLGKYCTLDGETEANRLTTRQYECNDDCSKPITFFRSKYFKDIQTDRGNNLDLTNNERKFKSSFDLDKYDFSLAKLLTKLFTTKGKRLKEDENIFD